MNSTSALPPLAILAIVLSAPAEAAPILAGDFFAGATVIDFEGEDTGLPSVPGVTFVVTPSRDSGFFGGSAPFLSGALFGEQSYSNHRFSDTFSDLAIEFDTPTPAVGAWVRRPGGTVAPSATMLTIAVFDSGDNLLEQTTVALPGSNDRASFVGFVRPEGIGRVEWQGGNTGFFAVDNVTFGAAVPEPSVVALLAGGLALAAARGSRRLSA